MRWHGGHANGAVKRKELILFGDVGKGVRSRAGASRGRAGGASGDVSVLGWEKKRVSCVVRATFLCELCVSAEVMSMAKSRVVVRLVGLATLFDAVATWS